ncbi:MAG: hypothetical protein HY072_10375 [Deltaproteobacteria bacterium]|nr:hypothetical protein [Deltaproteobacteria bacterium]
MLSKTGSALTKFIQPISTSELRIEKEQTQEQQNKKDPKHEDKQQDPIKTDNIFELQLKKETQEKNNTETTKLSNFTQSFLNIKNFLHISKTALRWMGEHAYQMAALIQRKGSRFKKGTMIDLKIE